MADNLAFNVCAASRSCVTENVQKPNQIQQTLTDTIEPTDGSRLTSSEKKAGFQTPLSSKLVAHKLPCGLIGCHLGTTIAGHPQRPRNRQPLERAIVDRLINRRFMTLSMSCSDQSRICKLAAFERRRHGPLSLHQIATDGALIHTNK